MLHLNIIFIFYKCIRKIQLYSASIWNNAKTKILFHCNNISFTSFQTNGVPYIMIARGGKCDIGNNFIMNNGINGNPIGHYEKCTFFVDKGARLTIGENVGISQTALIAIADITIGNNVKIGGGTCIYTSDFHCLDPQIRISKEDIKYRKNAPIQIKDNAFIGARSLILKGVTIGKNSIIGAGSVVTKSIPDNQIWAGNPAKFIRNIQYQ